MVHCQKMGNILTGEMLPSGSALCAFLTLMTKKPVDQQQPGRHVSTACGSGARAHVTQSGVQSLSIAGGIGVTEGSEHPGWKRLQNIPLHCPKRVTVIG